LLKRFKAIYTAVRMNRPDVKGKGVSLPFRPYVIYHPVSEIEQTETRGQSWLGSNIPEILALCPFQTIEPLFQKYLPRAGRILEAGCGTGRWVFYLRSRGYDICGVDLARSAIGLAKAYDSSAPVGVDDVCDLSFPDGHFRAVVSLGVIEHFEEGPGKALAQFQRVLSDGGLLIVTVPTQNLMRKLLTNRMKRFFRIVHQLQGVRYGFEEYRYTREQMIALLTGAGFHIIQVAPDDFNDPYDMGLYVDFPFLRDPKVTWRLNMAGRILRQFLQSLSLWIACSGTIFVCEKNNNQEQT
jgi:SAM-dependent methyltransferase